MTIDKLPPSGIRQNTQAAGARLVEQKAVTQTELDQLLRNPVLGAQERKEAAALIGALHARIETGALDANVTGAIAKLAKAVDAEAQAAPRLNAANDALAAGVIDKALYARLTRPRASLFAVAAVANASHAAQAEVKRLAPLAANAGPDTKIELTAKLDAAKTKEAALAKLLDAFPKHDLYGVVANSLLGVGAAASAVLLAMIVSGTGHDPSTLQTVAHAGVDIGAVGGLALLFRGFIEQEIRRVASQLG